MTDTRKLPAMHEASRLWFPTDAETLKACIAHLTGLKPGWSLSWLRDSAPFILNRELQESALRRALERHVPENAQDSVWAAVLLLIKFAREGQWTGVALPPHDVKVGLDSSVLLRPVGMFYSPTRNERRLFAIQPRLDYAPKPDQEQIWLSALHYEFCCDPLQPLKPSIIDLARSHKTHARSLVEITSANLPILDKEELDAKLDRVARCFVLAKGLVPPVEPRKSKEKDTGQIEMFPGEVEKDQT